MSSFRLAAIGDGLIGPLVLTGRGVTGRVRTFVDNRFLKWLRVILPGAELAEHAVFGTPGGTTVAVAKRAQAVLDLDPPPHAVLICAGLDDCLATIKGLAPRPEETVDALEALATKFVAARIMPIFVVPPPCVLFSNGLFADRYVAIAATLRRMHERKNGSGLVDPTGILMRRRSPGIEPDPRYVKAGSDGQLSSLGAFRVAQEVARQLRATFPQTSLRPSLFPQGVEALNENPFLVGSRGRIATDAASGCCASGYYTKALHMGGSRIQAITSDARKGRVAQRLIFSGRYTTQWALVQLYQEIDADTVNDLVTGDIIEAICEFDLAGPVVNIAAVSLHATAVWDNDFIGLHSGQYVGGPGVSEAHGGYLRTPQFTLPAKLKKLHVSIHVNLLPGVNLTSGGQLDIRSIVVRKVEQKRPIVDQITNRKKEARLEARSCI